MLFAILVEFHLKEGTRSQFRRLIDANADASVRNEPGCLQFDVLEPEGEALASCSTRFIATGRHSMNIFDPGIFGHLPPRVRLCASASLSQDATLPFRGRTSPPERQANCKSRGRQLRGDHLEVPG
jgi:Antibiotic biosynthesis monooxygenase